MQLPVQSWKTIFNITSIFVCSIPAQAVQENIAALLSLLRESVQLNLAPPGHFLLLGSVLTDEKLIFILKYNNVRVPVWIARAFLESQINDFGSKDRQFLQAVTQI